jgi:hypothetical protein
MEHPDTITAAENLAVTYLSQGRRIEVKKLRGEVLEKHGRLLWIEDPDTITAAAILADRYRIQGRWNDAERR